MRSCQRACNDESPAAAAIVRAMTRANGTLYVVGVFVETMVVNVPMNNTLDAVDPASDEGASYWRTYLRR